jgi:hypothetical protein
MADGLQLSDVFNLPEITLPGKTARGRGRTAMLANSSMAIFATTVFQPCPELLIRPK